MKILKNNNLIFERVKVRPLTNADLDRVQKEQKEMFVRIDNPTFADIKPDNVVRVDSDGSIYIYCV